MDVALCFLYIPPNFQKILKKILTMRSIWMILKMLLLKTHFVILLTGVKLVCTLLLFTPHKKTG